MTIRCHICPKGCELAEGAAGECHVRVNQEGTIRCITFDRPCSLHIDPIEKKPLYHFLPGTQTLSIGTAGCNLHCKQCQNWEMSQSSPTSKNIITKNDIVETAARHHCPSVSYTYAEPLVSYEFTKACCEATAHQGFKNVLVTAAYINPRPLRELCAHIDAANVDLKSFSNEFYREVCDAELAPVLNALKVMREMGVMIEITTLLIPTLNDSSEEIERLADWVVSALGPETPLHFSRFFPRYRLKHLPPTPMDTIRRAREIAINAGAMFVYVGNIADGAGESTWCPCCGALLIERRGYTIIQSNLSGDRCPSCASRVHGIWS